jgi:hypothetical protein
MSQNAAMDMPQAPPYAYHGYAGGYVPAGETSGLFPDITPVGSKPPSNSKLEVWHGRVRAAQSGIRPQGHTGTRVVVLVQVLHPHSLPLIAHSRLEAIMSSAREYETSASG